MRIKRSHRQADLRILKRHLALAGRNVRPALQNLRWNSGGNRWRNGVERRRGQTESRCRLSRQHGDGMFVLRSLLQHELKLCRRRIEQRGLLRDFQPIRDAAFVTTVDQVQPFLLDLDRLPYHSSLTVKFAQVEIVGGEFGGQHQTHILQIGRAALQRSVGRFQIAAHASE